MFIFFVGVLALVLLHFILLLFPLSAVICYICFQLLVWLHHVSCLKPRVSALHVLILTPF